MIEYTFNPVDFGFRWTSDGWYHYSSQPAERKAQDARDARAKQLKAEGFTVRRATRPRQRITMGGIGTEHPEITLVVPVFILRVTPKPLETAREKQKNDR